MTTLSWTTHKVRHELDDSEKILTLLPQMRTEDLDERDLQGRDLAVHEDTRQVKLDLETDVDIGAIDCRTPPECETTIGDLVQTGALRVRELLVPHRLLETGRLLPEQTLPGREVCTLEERMLKDTLHTTESSNNIDTIVIQLPQFTVMTLGCPPEGIVLKQLILLPIRSDSPPAVVSKSMTILLEERVDTRDTTVPAVLEIFES